MPTHAIGRGTVNLTINTPSQWRGILGRAAFRANKSRNDFICSLLERAIEVDHPDLAAEIKSVREKHRLGARIIGVRTRAAVLLALGLWVAWVNPDEPMRRPSRITRTLRERGVV